jgi:peroxiredoxin
MQVELNKPSPEFTLPDLEGLIHMLSDYRERIVIVNFWSAECPHSERFDTDVTACLAGWGPDVSLLSVASNANEPEGMLKAVSHQRKIPVVLRDTDQTVAGRYGAQTTPHAFLIDRLGILRYRGAVDNVSFWERKPTRFYLQEAVEALLAGQLPEVTEIQPFGCTIVRYA